MCSEHQSWRVGGQQAGPGGWSRGRDGGHKWIIGGLGGSALWANHLKGWYVFWNWPLSGFQGVEVCAGLLQSVCRVTGCVQDAALTFSLAHQD